MSTPDHLSLTIRRAGVPEAATVMEMVREIAALENQLEHLKVTRQRWACLLHLRDVIVLIAYRDDVPVGYVSAIRRIHLWSEQDVLALDDLYVREHARYDGIGRALMAELAASYAAPDQLTITWGVQPDNYDAQRFYRRLGATLRDKVIAGWSPAAYAPVIEVQRNSSAARARTLEA